MLYIYTGIINVVYTTVYTIIIVYNNIYKSRLSLTHSLSLLSTHTKSPPDRDSGYGYNIMVPIYNISILWRDRRESLTRRK